MSERRSKWDQSDSLGQSPPPPPASGSSPAPDPAAAAAAAAARIAAQLGPRNPTPSTYGSGSPPGGGAGTPPSGRGDGRSPEKKGPDAHDSEFTMDIDINDQKNRYLLTKGQTQQQLHRETGASVTTKGTWYPDRTMATEKEPPLYLHVSATSQEILDSAVAKVHEFMAQDLNLQDDRYKRRREWEEQQTRGPPERRKWPEEKVFIGLQPLRNFNLRAKVVGPQGLFVKYIQGETNTRVQIKGIGSGFIELADGREAEEELHLHITGPDEGMLARAKELAEDLVDAVKTEWEKARAAQDAQGMGGPGGYGQPYGGGGPEGGPMGQQPYGPGQGYGRGYGQGGYAGGGPGGYGPPGGYGGPHGYGQSPPAPDGAPPPPPPPEDDAPPPPPEDAQPPPPGGGGYAGAGGARHQVSQAPGAADSIPAQSDQAAYEQYWKDYRAWEEQYKAYYGVAPPPPEGAPPPPPGDSYASGASAANGSGATRQDGGRGRYGAVPPPP